MAKLTAMRQEHQAGSTLVLYLDIAEVAVAIDKNLAVSVALSDEAL